MAIAKIPSLPITTIRSSCNIAMRLRKTVFTSGDLQPVLTGLTTVPYNPEEAERQSLKVFWRKQLESGAVAPDSTNAESEILPDD